MEGVQITSFAHSDSRISSSASLGESDSFSNNPWWVQWISIVILSLTFIIGLPLNGATVLIFCRRKKLRHLVNFVLLLDCLSHIVLCLFCIPLHLITEWNGPSSSFLTYSVVGEQTGVAFLQQVIGNFVNLYSTFLTLSIAILRYRRLCWKKKDKFSTVNALKWSVSSGILAVGVTFVQSYVVMMPENGSTITTIYLGKISLILLAVATVIFCYVRVSQRVWANTANQEKTMDPAKLKKSRSVHLKATIHSCVQIVLIIFTVLPHLYLQALDMLVVSSASNPQLQTWSGGSNSGSSDFEHIADPIMPASSPHQQPLFSFSQLYHNQPDQNQIVVGQNGLAGGGWLDNALSFSRRSQQHFDSFSGSSVNPIAEGVLPQVSNSTTGGSAGIIGDSFVIDQGGVTRETDTPISITIANRFSSLFGPSQLFKLIAITLNYVLLAIGTPCAYIASCHRFREQFTSILFSHVINSPQNSTCHHHQHGHNQHSSPGHKTHNKDRYHYHHRSTTGGTQDACFSSPFTRGDRTSTTALQNHSSVMSKGSKNGHTNGVVVGGTGSSIVRESVSISANTRSSFSQSYKSRSSLRKGSSCGSSMKRRSSSVGIGGNSSCNFGGIAIGGKGLMGASVAGDSVFIESESALMLDQDVSNGSSSMGNLKPSPTREEEDEVSGRSSLGELVRKNSSCHLPMTAITTIAGHSSNLHCTYLQNYGGYDCGTDLGQLV